MLQKERSEPHQPLTIDLYIDRLFGCQNCEVRLSATEHHILVNGFFQNVSRRGYCVCSDDDLIHIVGCHDDDQLQPIRKAIYGLRKKLKKACGHCCNIQYTAPLQGYHMTNYSDCTIILPLKDEDLSPLSAEPGGHSAGNGLESSGNSHTVQC